MKSTELPPNSNLVRPAVSAGSALSLPAKECEKFNNSSILEGLSSVSALIQGIRSGINQRRLQTVWLDREKAHSKKREYSFLLAASRELGYTIEWKSHDDIEKVTIGNTHGGIVAFCTERPLPLLSDCFRAPSPSVWKRSDAFFMMLEGMEDPYNFGYALRSLYAAGVDGIILPPRNWMGAAGIVARASAGASELFPMAVAEPQDAILSYKKRGYRIICAGIRDSISMEEADLHKPLLLIVGGEKRGISRTVLDLADQVVRIDYGRSFRGSLSAASAATVLSFAVLRQNKQG